MRQIPFHRPAIGPDEEREVLEALRSGWITTGPKAKQFEKDFAAYVGARNALAVAHCTGALHLALFAIGITPGDRIITTPFTFTATAEVMGYVGAEPLFVDIDPATFNLDPDLVERALKEDKSGRIRAIMPVHFAGHPCDMQRLMELARRYNLKVIDDALAAKIAVASLHGMDRDAWKRYDASGSWYYEIHDMGFKYNLSDVHAAIGLAQLRRSGELTARRRAIAAQYNDAFASNPGLEIPRTGPDVEHAWHLYVLRLRPERLRIDRNEFVEQLRKRGVGTSVHCIPLHTMHYYQRRYGYRAGEFPVAENVFSRCFSLPIYPLMSDADVAYVIEAVAAIVDSALV